MKDYAWYKQHRAHIYFAMNKELKIYNNNNNKHELKMGESNHDTLGRQSMMRHEQRQDMNKTKCTWQHKQKYDNMEVMLRVVTHAENHSMHRSVRGRICDNVSRLDLSSTSLFLAFSTFNIFIQSQTSGQKALC